jgi:hypothetical protein
MDINPCSEKSRLTASWSVTEARRLGACAVLDKPVDLEVLRATVCELARAGSAPR